MYLHPFNRHLLVELVDEQATQEESSGILLPEDYQKKVEKFAVAEVVEVSEDCSLHLLEGDFIVVDRAMVDTVDVRGMTFNLILENYVYGRVDEGEEEDDE
jgi:co-chaperonin GroES (HSP10)